MTLTFAGIARARLVVVTVAGESKREALGQACMAGDGRARPTADRRRRGDLAGRPGGRGIDVSPPIGFAG